MTPPQGPREQRASLLRRAERLVHGALESAPSLKRKVVRLYQTAWGVLPAPEQIPLGLQLVPDCFLGFHDKCPWSQCGRYVAVHRPHSPDADPAGSTVQIGLLDLHSPTEYRPIAQSKLWNWQQGAELQWLTGTGCVVFNQERRGVHASALVDPQGRVVHGWDLPIAALDPSGQTALSIHFGELARGAPGYGYLQARGCHPGQLRLVCLRDGSSSTIFDVRSMEVARRWGQTHGDPFLSHPSFSPDGRLVLFYCRARDGRGRLRTAVYSVHLESGHVTRLQLDHCSHYCWVDNHTILAYARPVAGRWQYLTVALGEEPTVEPASWLGETDGHPQVAGNRRSVITDSYPDRQRIQRLFMGDLRTRTVTQIAALRIPRRFRDEYRCDFHPRWSRDGSHVAIDTAHTGVRSVGILPVEPSWR